MMTRFRLPLLDADGFAAERPKTRGDCKDGYRPCPWVACRHHLALHLTADGAVTIATLQGKGPGGGRGRQKHQRVTDSEFIDHVLEMPHTCSLDLADAGGRILENVGETLGVTRERVRQLEARGIRRLRVAMAVQMKERSMQDIVDEKAKAEAVAADAHEWVNLREAASLLNYTQNYTRALATRGHITQRRGKGLAYQYGRTSIEKYIVRRNALREPIKAASTIRASIGDQIWEVDVTPKESVNQVAKRLAQAINGPASRLSPRSGVTIEPAPDIIHQIGVLVAAWNDKTIEATVALSHIRDILSAVKVQL